MSSWLSKITAVLFLLLAVAITARVVYELLRPLLPSLAALTMVFLILCSVFNRRRYW